MTTESKPGLSLNSYPNPAGNRVSIKWQASRRGPVTISLYDLAGQMVRRIRVAEEEMSGVLRLDTKSLTAGVYLVRLKTLRGSVTSKLVLKH